MVEEQWGQNASLWHSSAGGSDVAESDNSRIQRHVEMLTFMSWSFLSSLAESRVLKAEVKSMNFCIGIFGLQMLEGEAECQVDCIICGTVWVLCKF